MKHSANLREALWSAVRSTALAGSLVAGGSVDHATQLRAFIAVTRFSWLALRATAEPQAPRKTAQSGASHAQSKALRARGARRVLSTVTSAVLLTRRALAADAISYTACEGALLKISSVDSSTFTKKGPRSEAMNLSRLSVESSSTLRWCTLFSRFRDDPRMYGASR